MRFILDYLQGILWWILGFPIVCLAATPIILSVSLLGGGSYWTKVRWRDGGLIDFWKDYGMAFTP